jgi:hypothetical protein
MRDLDSLVALRAHFVFVLIYFIDQCRGHCCVVFNGVLGRCFSSFLLVSTKIQEDGKLGPVLPTLLSPDPCSQSVVPSLLRMRKGRHWRTCQAKTRVRRCVPSIDFLVPKILAGAVALVAMG